MRYRHAQRVEDAAPDGVEIEEEIVPLSRKRWRQIIIAGAILLALVVLGWIATLIAQKQQAADDATQAVMRQLSVEARLTVQSSEMSNGQQIVDTLVTADAMSKDRLTATVAESRSRELAYLSGEQREVDPERSILIALEAYKAAPTIEAEDALRQALLTSHLRLMLRGTAGTAELVQFSPDGTRILTIGAAPASLTGEPNKAALDQTRVRVWDAGDGQELFQLRGHTQPVTVAQFSNDGSRILTVAEDRTVRVWDTRYGLQRLVRPTYRDTISTAAFSPDGQRIAAAGDDGTVHIWNAASGDELLVLSPNPPLTSGIRLEWSSDTRSLLEWSSRDATVWDIDTGRQLFGMVNLAPETGGLVAHFSPDGRQLVTASDLSITLWDARSGEVVFSLGDDAGNSAQFSPDGQFLLTAGREGRLMSPATGRILIRFKNVAQAIFSPDGKQVATCCDQNAVTIWNIEDATQATIQVSLLRYEGDFTQMLFSPDSRRLLTAGSDGAARVWDIMPLGDLPAPVEELIRLAHDRITRELTCEERQHYLHEDKGCPLATAQP